MTIKMIASDMDGTFLDHKGTYDRERFEKVLQVLKARDIEFVVASGNQMGRLRRMFDGLVDELTFVAENGAELVENGRVTLNQFLDKDLLLACLTYFQDRWLDYHVMVTGQKASYALKGMQLEPAEGFAITADELKTFFANIQYLEDLKELPEDEFLKVTMMVPLDEVEAIMAEFNENFSEGLTAVSSGYGGIDIIQTGINKAWGLQQLLDKRGLTPKELMAFGDGGNDIEMLQLAEYSYAVANAPQSVKDEAKYLAPSNQDKGVLTVIEAYLKGESDVREEII